VEVRLAGMPGAPSRFVSELGGGAARPGLSRRRSRPGSGRGSRAKIFENPNHIKGRSRSGSQGCELASKGQCRGGRAVSIAADRGPSGNRLKTGASGECKSHSEATRRVIEYREPSHKHSWRQHALDASGSGGCARETRCVWPQKAAHFAGQTRFSGRKCLPKPPESGSSSFSFLPRIEGFQGFIADFPSGSGAMTSGAETRPPGRPFHNGNRYF